jgi:fatty-acyl-CoA synthase
VSSVLDFSQRVDERPSAPLVHYDELTLTRAELWQEAARYAAAFAGLGIGRGDRVALVRRNCPTHISAWLGAQWLGAVLVPLNYRLAPAEMVSIMADCAPRAVLCGPTQARNLDAWAAEHPEIAWVLVGPQAELEPRPSRAWHTLDELDTASAPPPLALASTDDSLLIYTSGTTGRPKGVRITQGNLRATWANQNAALPVGESDIALSVAAYGHVGGINTFGLQLVIQGGQLAIARQFDAAEVIALIERHRVTVGFFVPTMCQTILGHPALATADLSSLRGLVVGGAYVSADLLASGAGRGLPLISSWGMTECAGGGTILDVREAARHAGSIGKPMRHVEVRLVGQDGRDITDPGRVGEMLVRGPNVSPGYWHRPEADAETFVDGWLRTGDLVMRDAENYLYLVGRLKEVIISGGENIYPAELELALRAHPAVEDVAVVGVPDPRWGETPVVFVVPRPGYAPTLAEVRAFLSKSVARFKLPNHLRLLVTLPLGGTLKVDYRALSRMACQAVGAGD